MSISEGTDTGMHNKWQVLVQVQVTYVAAVVNEWALLHVVRPILVYQAVMWRRLYSKFESL
jgi:hypothetical protein